MREYGIFYRNKKQRLEDLEYTSRCLREELYNKTTPYLTKLRRRLLLIENRSEVYLDRIDSLFRKFTGEYKRDSYLDFRISKWKQRIEDNKDEIKELDFKINEEKKNIEIEFYKNNKRIK